MADILMVHGTPAADLDYFLETVTLDGIRAATTGEIEARVEEEGEARVLLCGHTYVPRV